MYYSYLYPYSTSNPALRGRLKFSIIIYVSQNQSWHCTQCRAVFRGDPRAPAQPYDPCLGPASLRKQNCHFSKIRPAALFIRFFITYYDSLKITVACYGVAKTTYFYKKFGQNKIGKFADQSLRASSCNTVHSSHNTVLSIDLLVGGETP